ncbi:MAG TPA: helix-turn-helix domain-containing protein, partial [Acidimicrobiales bacterium]|nr:helix-turn-helix domain-containing protein [Acidimicrobiales bacterium]
MVQTEANVEVGAEDGAARTRAPRGEPGDTRERILDIALELFTTQGYDKTSLRQIAEQLGFSKAAIYYHFASKEDILLA